MRYLRSQRAIADLRRKRQRGLPFPRNAFAPLPV